MKQTVEAIIDEQGHVRLAEPVKIIGTLAEVKLTSSYVASVNSDFLTIVNSSNLTAKRMVGAVDTRSKY